MQSYIIYIAPLCYTVPSSKYGESPLRYAEDRRHYHHLPLIATAYYSSAMYTVLEISKLVRLRLGNVDQPVLANSPGPITKRYAPSEVNVERRVTVTVEEAIRRRMTTVTRLGANRSWSS